jgi:hypothetical protein
MCYFNSQKEVAPQEPRSRGTFSTFGTGAAGGSRWQGEGGCRWGWDAAARFLAGKGGCPVSFFKIELEDGFQL